MVSGEGRGGGVLACTGVVNVEQAGHLVCEVCAVESSKKAEGDGHQSAQETAMFGRETVSGCKEGAEAGTT